jgi:hypothetical protein
MLNLAYLMLKHLFICLNIAKIVQNLFSLIFNVLNKLLKLLDSHFRSFYLRCQAYS